MPSVVGSGGVSGGATGFTLSPTSGGSPSNGDLRIVCVSTAAASSLTVPAGWDTVSDTVIGSGHMVIASRVFQTGDVTQTFSISPSSQFVEHCMSVSAADASNIVVATNGGTTATAIVAPTVTPVVANSLLLTFHAVTRASGATTTTMSVPGGMTQVLYIPGTSSAAHVALTNRLALTDTSATGTKTSTVSGSGNWRAASLVIAPPVTVTTVRSDFEPFMGPA